LWIEEGFGVVRVSQAFLQVREATFSCLCEWVW